MNNSFFVSAALTSAFALLSVFSLESFRKPPKPAEPVSIGEFIYTVPINKEKRMDKLSPEWYNEFLEPQLKDSLLNPIIEGVVSKKLPVYKTEYPFREKMNADSALSSIQYLHLADVYDEYGMETGEYDSSYYVLDPSEVVAITFHEEWFYDAPSATLIKKVKGIIPQLLDYNKGLLFPMFYVPFTDGSISNRSAGVTGITYGYAEDQGIDYEGNTYYNIFPADSNVKVKQGAAYSELLASMKKQCHEENSVICYPSFPHSKIMESSSRAAVMSSIDKAIEMQFKEDWTVDYSSMHFVKYVRGVNLGQKVMMKVNVGDVVVENYVDQEVSLYHAYVPMNNSVHQNELPGVVVVERMNYGAVYNYGYSFVNYPRIETKDSSKLANVLLQIFENARAGEQPVYGDSTYHYYFDAWDQQWYTLSDYHREEIFWPHNPQYSELDNYYNVTERDTIPFSRYCGYRFYETWNFNPLRSIFTKDIYAIGALRYSQKPNSEDYIKDYVGVAFGYYNPTDPVDSIKQPKYLIAKHVITPVQLNMSEEDAISSNKEYFERYFTYGSHASYDENLEYYKRYQLVESVIQNVQSGKTIAWSGTDKNKKLTVPEFNSLLDSIMKQCSVQRPYIHVALTEIAFDEDWYYNPRNGQFYKHVNSITFGRRLFTANEYDVNREYEGAQFQPGLRYFTILVNQ